MSISTKIYINFIPFQDLEDHYECNLVAIKNEGPVIKSIIASQDLSIQH